MLMVVGMGALVTYAMSLCRFGQQAIYNAFSKILDEKEARKMAMSTAQELFLQGEASGEIKGEKNAILTVLTAKFGKVPKAVRDAVNSYSDLTALNSLTATAGTCKSLNEFKNELR